MAPAEEGVDTEVVEDSEGDSGANVEVAHDIE